MATAVTVIVAHPISHSNICQVQLAQVKYAVPNFGPWPRLPDDQMTRLPSGLTWILGRNALGFRSRMASTALCRVPSFSRLLKQLRQLQASQYRPDAKHSQYLQQYSSQGTSGV